MLELLGNNITDLFIDGISDLFRQGEIQKTYNLSDMQMCRDLDVKANLDVKNLTFSFDLSYRSYPASLKLVK